MSAPALSWQDRALCVSADPDLFFPEGGPSAPAATAQAEEAKRVCAACPVRAECLASAEATGQHHGVWGGTAGHERARAVPPVLLCDAGRHLLPGGSDLPGGRCAACTCQSRRDADRKRNARRVRDQSGSYAARKARQAAA